MAKITILPGIVQQFEIPSELNVEALEAQVEELNEELTAIRDAYARLAAKVNDIDLTGTAGLVAAFAKGFQIPKGPDHPGNFVLSVSVDVNTNEVTREWRTL